MPDLVWAPILRVPEVEVILAFEGGAGGNFGLGVGVEENEPERLPARGIGMLHFDRGVSAMPAVSNTSIEGCLTES